MTSTLCIRCGQPKYECHSSTPPHPSLPSAAECVGYANVLGAEGPTYEPGGGSSGGGGASGNW